MTYLVLDVGCAECRADPSDGPLAIVLGVALSIDEAYALARPAAERHNYTDPWRACNDGWWSGAGDGDLRIIDLDRLEPQPQSASGTQ